MKKFTVTWVIAFLASLPPPADAQSNENYKGLVDTVINLTNELNTLKDLTNSESLIKSVALTYNSPEKT